MVPIWKTTMTLAIGSLQTKYAATVMDNINYDVILGNDLPTAFNTNIYYEGPTVTLNELPTLKHDIGDKNRTSYWAGIEEETREQEATKNKDPRNKKEQCLKQRFKFKQIKKVSVNPKSTCRESINEWKV
jgi:hypothetical protein